jgi:ornithine decarboxylase/arginine decarboxylase
LLTALQQFKDDFDRNAPMWRILPEFCAAHPKYERLGLAELCREIHDTYAKGDIAHLTTDMYLSDLQPAMKPAEAYGRIAHGDTERVAIDELEGRIATSLLTPYPPGIPLLVPGERFNRKIVDYLRFTRDFNARFPGFDTDVHGLVEDEPPGPDGSRHYYVDCVRG